MSCRQSPHCGRPLPSGCGTCPGTFLTSVCLSFLICRTGLIMGLLEELGKLIQVEGVERCLPPRHPGLHCRRELSVPAPMCHPPLCDCSRSPPLWASAT